MRHSQPRFYRIAVPVFLVLAGISLVAFAPPPAALVVSGGPLARPAQQITPTPSVTPPSLPGGLLHEPNALPGTEAQLASVALPPRDRIALAERLNGVTDIPAPPASPARIWQVGDTTTFWVDNQDTHEKFQVEAALRYITDHAYIWVEPGYEVDEAALRRSADTFSQHTYPLVRQTFGSEWLPGIDGDPRVYILHAANLGAGIAGYFAYESEEPPQAVSTSNAHEMFFINLDAMASTLGTASYDAVLAHEFQHMVHWHIDLNEDTWLGEGLSELAALLTGFDRRGFASIYLNAPQTQLNAWPDDNNQLARYGAAFLFVTYFHERFGLEATRALVADPANGFASVDDTLQRLAITDPLIGEPVTHQDVFADWTIANLLNDPAVGDGRYAYTLLDPSLPTAAITASVDAYPYAQTTSLPQYSAHYVQLSRLGQQRMRLDFQGAGQVRLVPAEARSGRYMWYGNRGDSSDSTLTRAFDLSGVSKASLEFDTWYDIETLWDYAYVMVSADDGATWTALPTAHTTDEDPHNNAYGPGYTGQSSQYTTDGWLHEQADLSPFVGGRVLVRFEMITDEATNQPGIVIDNVRIPEIGYAENFEKGPGGWITAGWLYIDNVLEQRWIVQAVTRNAAGTAVARLLGPADGASGSWEFDVGGPAGVVTLVISPLAPVTTEPGVYTLTVTPVK